MRAEEFKKCYWLVEDQIFAGPYPFNPGHAQPLLFLHGLLGLGLDSFIDLTEEDELTHYQKHLAGLSDRPVNYRRFAIEDFSAPSPALMREIQNYIADELLAGRRIYLHCFGGIGRTGTVAACCLIEKGMTSRQALEELQKKFSFSASSKWATTPETEEQISFVKNWRAQEST